jgi:hypothetical protein
MTSALTAAHHRGQTSPRGAEVRRQRRARLVPAILAAALLSASGCGHGGHAASSSGGTAGSSSSSSGGGSGGGAINATDITAAILANEDVTVTGDSVIRLPPGTTTYTGVISGQGTLRLTPAGGTAQPSVLVITKTSTLTLPDAEQVEIVTKTTIPGWAYTLDISGTNPPVLTIDPGVTLRIGTNTAADENPNIIATSDSKNLASVVNGEVNLDNIRNDGAIELNSSQYILLGETSGSGTISQPANVWGGNSAGGVSTVSGVLALAVGQDFGSDRVPVSLPKAKAVINEGSWLVWCPYNHMVTVTQNIYEPAYGGDVNFHPIGNARIIMSGVYGHADNSPYGSPNLTDPGLSDPSLNLAKVIYKGGTYSVNGHDASYRGINIEAGGTVQWGDGTHDHFFLPSAPSPAEVYPALGSKNAYINLHKGGTLAFNYNGPVTLNVGITGGGGGPDKDGSTGTGNVTVMGTPGNDVTFAQPQNYNGTTTIEAGAILRLGAGAPVPLNYVTIDSGGNKTTQLIATYDGESSLLTAQSANGASTDAIVVDGTLIVQNVSTAVTLSNISGTGTLLHKGSATTTLQKNSFSGGTTIDAGSVIAGSADAFGSGGLDNHAALSLAPGQHQLDVGGSFTQSAQGTLTLTIDGTTPGTNAGHLKVSAKATLGGALTLAFSTSIAKGTKIVIIDAAGGLSGSFSAVKASGASVTSGQDATSLYVTIN